MANIVKVPFFPLQWENYFFLHPTLRKYWRVLSCNFKISYKPSIKYENLLESLKRDVNRLKHPGKLDDCMSKKISPTNYQTPSVPTRWNRKIHVSAIFNTNCISLASLKFYCIDAGFHTEVLVSLQNYIFSVFSEIFQCNFSHVILVFYTFYAVVNTII